MVLLNAAFGGLPAWCLNFRIRLPCASFPVAHCFSPMYCSPFAFGVLAPTRTLTVIQAFRFHPYPLPSARRWRRILGGKVILLSFLVDASWASGASSANCQPAMVGRGKHKGNTRSWAGPIILFRGWFSSSPSTLQSAVGDSKPAHPAGPNSLAWVVAIPGTELSSWPVPATQL